MDGDYASIEWSEPPPPTEFSTPAPPVGAPFAPALEVLATVVSTPAQSRWGGRKVICDAGSKAIDLTSGPPCLSGGTSSALHDSKVLVNVIYQG
jgi:D-serine deaminase-like pyridoxal phosphate-dependent protein